MNSSTIPPGWHTVPQRGIDVSVPVLGNPGLLRSGVPPFAQIHAHNISPDIRIGLPTWQVTEAVIGPVDSLTPGELALARGPTGVTITPISGSGA